MPTLGVGEPCRWGAAWDGRLVVAGAEVELHGPPRRERRARVDGEAGDWSDGDACEALEGTDGSIARV